MGIFNSNVLIFITLSIMMAALVLLFQTTGKKEPQVEETINTERIKLPEPRYNSPTSVEKAILKRRSVRDYSDSPLNIEEVSQLLWAAQGITDPRGYRTAPSAGALYPLELYLAVANVINLSTGIYKYIPEDHELEMIWVGDPRGELSSAALGQTLMEDASAIMVFSAIYERTTGKYGERGVRYTHMEVGHAAQNVYLQAVSLDLGTVIIGAFYDDEIKKVMNMTDLEQPLAIMPLGKIK